MTLVQFMHEHTFVTVVLAYIAMVGVVGIANAIFYRK